MPRIKLDTLLFLFIVTCFAKLIFCENCRTSGPVGIDCDYGCCGDNIYHQYCCSAPYWDWYRIIGVVIGGIVVVAFLIMAIILICAYCQKKQPRNSTRVIPLMIQHPPPRPLHVAHPPPQPPAYNTVVKYKQNTNNTRFPQSNAGYGLPPPYSNPSVAGTSTQSNRGVHNGQDHRVPPTATADPHIITITDSDSYM